MNCNKQTMLKVSIGLLLVMGSAYAALPAFRAWILAAAPTLLLLLCPLSMLFCMKMMHGQNGQNCQAPASPEKKQADATKPSDVVPNHAGMKEPDETGAASPAHHWRKSP